jgi:hypothetical protein
MARQVQKRRPQLKEPDRKLHTAEPPSDVIVTKRTEDETRE